MNQLSVVPEQRINQPPLLSPHTVKKLRKERNCSNATMRTICVFWCSLPVLMPGTQVKHFVQSWPVVGCCHYYAWRENSVFSYVELSTLSFQKHWIMSQTPKQPQLFLAWLPLSTYKQLNMIVSLLTSIFVMLFS